MTMKKLLGMLFGLSMALNIIFTVSWMSSMESQKIFRISKQNQNKTEISSKQLKALNNFDYSYLINTNKNYCGKDNGRDLLFIAFVTVSPKSFEKRDLIRSTWANSKYLKSKAKVIFLIGRSNEKTVNHQIKNESLKYADIVQNDFMDTYYNLTIKTIMGFKWVSSYCQNAKYTLKIDDDVVVNVPFLIDYLEGLVKKNKHQKNTLFGKCLKKTKVIRNTKSKFYMPKNEFENDYYHEYCLGLAYLVSSDLVLNLYKKSFLTRLLKFEDVYVGLMANSLNSTFVYVNKNYHILKWRKKKFVFKKDKRLDEKYFINSNSHANFKDIWNFLVKKYF